MSADIIHLCDREEVADLEKLWLDFLMKRDVSLARPTIATAVAAGRAYGELLTALAHADELSLVAMQQRYP